MDALLSAVDSERCSLCCPQHRRLPSMRYFKHVARLVRFCNCGIKQGTFCALRTLTQARIAASSSQSPVLYLQSP